MEVEPVLKYNRDDYEEIEATLDQLLNEERSYLNILVRRTIDNPGAIFVVRERPNLRLPFRDLQLASAKKGPIKGSEKKQDRLRLKFLCSKLDRRDVGDENGYKQFLKSLLAHIKTNMQVLPNDN